MVGSGLTTLVVGERSLIELLWFPLKCRRKVLFDSEAGY